MYKQVLYLYNHNGGTWYSRASRYILLYLLPIFYNNTYVIITCNDPRSLRHIMTII